MEKDPKFFAATAGMDAALFDPLTLVFALLFDDGRSLFNASIACSLWNKAFRSEENWRRRYMLDFAWRNLALNDQDASMSYRERYAKAVTSTLISEIVVGGPAFTIEDANWSSHETRNAKVPFTVNVGRGIPKYLPFRWNDAYANGVFGELDITHINDGDYPLLPSQFKILVSLMLQVFGGSGREEPGENDPLPDNLLVEIRGQSLFFAYFFSPNVSDSDVVTDKSDDGADIFLSLDVKRLGEKWQPADNFAMYLVYRQMKKFNAKIKERANKKKKIGGVHSNPYQKVFQIKWRIVRKMFHWDSLKLLGRDFRGDGGDFLPDNWPNIEQWFIDLEQANAYLKNFTFASKKGKMGTIVYNDPLVLKNLFRQPGTGDYGDNTEEIIMNVINADLEGRKLAPEEWIEEEVKSKVYSPGPRSLRPYQPPPPDPEDQYRRQVQNLVDMGFLDREAVLMAIISAEGDLAAAIATLTDPANVSRSNRQPSPRRDYHPQVPSSPPVAQQLYPNAPLYSNMPQQPISPAIQAQPPRPVEADLMVKYKAQLEMIRSMGVSDDNKSLAALERSKGNVDHALAIIFGD